MWATLFVLLTAACDALTGPGVPTDAVQFEALDVYAEWWRMVESCSGLRGALSAVRWYSASEESIAQFRGRNSAAFWSSSGNRIVVSSNLLGSGQIVRHEMLHALIRRDGHARTYFLERCGGVVTCVENCLVEAGAAPRPSPTARRIPPESLKVRSLITPSAPGSGTWDGFVMLTVEAQNPYMEPVVLVLPPSGDAGPPSSFSFTAESPRTWMRYDARVEEGGVLLFAPRERKQMVFDFRIGRLAGAYSLSPGEWTMRGFFGEHPAEPITVTIAP